MKQQSFCKAHPQKAILLLASNPQQLQCKFMYNLASTDKLYHGAHNLPKTIYNILYICTIAQILT